VTAPFGFVLFLVSLVAGALNAVAGGGSFITLPALIYGGVSPVVANATSTMALWPGSLSSALAYRSEVSLVGRWLPMFAGASLVGGLLGALLLVRTSNAAFVRLLPWLMLVAAVTFTFGRLLTSRLKGQTSNPFGAHTERPTIWTLLLQLVIATYGGYFGGGMGIMMLAIFAVTGMTDMHAMNGLKAILAVAINGVALVAFVYQGAVAWTPGLVMVAGGILGGYAGAAIARRLDEQHVRTFAIIVAWAMTVYFFLR
jgi:uncharacterized membrane protein YfcA